MNTRLFAAEYLFSFSFAGFFGKGFSAANQRGSSR